MDLDSIFSDFMRDEHERKAEPVTTELDSSTRSNQKHDASYDQMIIDESCEEDHRAKLYDRAQESEVPISACNGWTSPAHYTTHESPSASSIDHVMKNISPTQNTVTMMDQGPQSTVPRNITFHEKKLEKQESSGKSSSQKKTRSGHNDCSSSAVDLTSSTRDSTGSKIHTSPTRKFGRELSCDFCQKKFYHSGDLNKHRRKHTGERPYNCVQCERKFAHASNLARHQQVHSGIRPFACPHCPRTFTRRDKLSLHVAAGRCAYPHNIPDTPSSSGST